MQVYGTAYIDSGGVIALYKPGMIEYDSTQNIF